MALPDHKSFFSSEAMTKSLTQLTGSELKGKQFATAMLQIVATNNLAEADPKSVYMAATYAATLNLSVQPMLGHCYFLPFRNNKSGKIDVQFILGYKGFVQLALRTGQYTQINAQVIYKNENPKWDKLNEVLTINGTDGSGEIAGFYGCFRLVNGFAKCEFFTVERIIAHAKRYSKQKDKDGNLTNVWKANFEEMALKTVLRSILLKYGILSTEIEGALSKESEAEVTEVEAEEVEPANIESESDFVLRKIKEAQDEKDLLSIREDVLELAEVQLIECFNLKCHEFKTLPMIIGNTI